MKLLIEGYLYRPEDVKGVLPDDTLWTPDQKVRIEYVGYFHNPQCRDFVFFLPKVLLEPRKIDGVEADRVFCTEKVPNGFAPEEIIDPERLAQASGGRFDERQKAFLYEFAVWIYRVLSRFDETHAGSEIILKRSETQAGSFRRRSVTNTLLDVILALRRFAHDNRDYFLFKVKEKHSGTNKINWTRTIAKSAAVMTDGAPVYLNPRNKKRVIDFDEELLVIFYSILRYVGEKFGFPVSVNEGYELIVGEKFKRYLAGYGRTRLRQIKYKYFSDRDRALWELCFAFFDRAHRANVVSDREEYLLAKDFNVIFESVIDDLIGDGEVASFKAMKDGKEIDHLYVDESLTRRGGEAARTFYIADSKYYKQGNALGEESVFKQFTYAKNMLQLDLDLFLGGDEASAGVKARRAAFERRGVGLMRDETTEGYDVIPNFFISATLPGNLSYECDGLSLHKDNAEYRNVHFENRLFDRDTLLVAHYDVNFLFVVSLYARAKASEKRRWKEKVRVLFRAKIQGLLQGRFDFYAMTPKADVDAEQFLRENFQVALGKVYAPYGDAGAHTYYSLALDRDAKFKDENEAVLGRLKQGFKVAECPLGADPATVVAAEAPVATAPVPKRFLTHCWIENDLERYFLVGCCKDAAHRSWMFGRSKGKRNDLYNVRLGARAGAVVADAALTQSPKFLVLYMFDDPGDYAVYRIRGGRTRTKEQMEKLGYPGASGDYYCYVLEEEVTLGDLDVAALLADRRREAGAAFVPGAPLYLKGGELIGYRK